MDTTDVVVAAAKALARAARFAEAAALLDLPSLAADHPAVAVARADVAVSADWHHGAITATDTLVAAAAVVEASDDAAARWDLGFLFLRHAYSRQLADPATHVGSAAGRASEHIADLRRQATTLRDDAPADPRRGWAEFYLGVIADNVFGEREAAPAHYTAALKVAEQYDDDLLAFEALRHLGDHTRDDGDEALTRQQWERSAWHAARAGAVRPALAQQMLLAVAARDRGDEAGAVLLAGEIARWAGAIGARRVVAEAEAFLAGQDVTKAPDDA